MVEVKIGNVFDTDAKYICHQVNCKGKMASGVAKEVRERYPNVYWEYMSIWERAVGLGTSLLGQAQFVKAEPNRTIVNCFAQDNYGYDGGQYTNIKALKLALSAVAAIAKQDNSKVAMPYKIGCVRGGAEWSIVEPMIEEIFKDVHCELWKLD